MHQANPPAVLAFREADEYGYRPAVAQDVLFQFLDAVGLPRMLTEGGGWPESVQRLRSQAASVAHRPHSMTKDLTGKIVHIVQARRRFGYRRTHAMLRLHLGT